MNRQNQAKQTKSDGWQSNDVIAALTVQGESYNSIAEDVGCILEKKVSNRTVSSVVRSALTGSNIRGKQSLLILSRIETTLCKPIFPQLEKVRPHVY